MKKADQNTRLNEKMMSLIEADLERVLKQEVPVTLRLSPEQIKRLTASEEQFRAIFSEAQMRQLEEIGEDLLTAAEIEFYLDHASVLGDKIERLLASQQTASTANELEAAFPTEQREYFDDLARRWKRLEEKNSNKARNFAAWLMSEF